MFTGLVWYISILLYVNVARKNCCWSKCDGPASSSSSTAESRKTIADEANASAPYLQIPHEYMLVVINMFYVPVQFALRRRVSFVALHDDPSPVCSATKVLCISRIMLCRW